MLLVPASSSGALSTRVSLTQHRPDSHRDVPARPGHALGAAGSTTAPQATSQIAYLYHPACRYIRILAIPASRMRIPAARGPAPIRCKEVMYILVNSNLGPAQRQRLAPWGPPQANNFGPESVFSLIFTV